MWAAGLSLLVFLGLTVVARGGPTEVDRAIYDAVHPLDAGPLGDYEDTVVQIFDAPIWTALVLLAGAVLWSRRRRGLAVLLAIGVTVEAATLAAKLMFGLFAPGLLSGYPSGHVARVAVTGGMVLLWLVLGHRPRIEIVIAGIVVACAVLVVGTMRVMSGVHRPIDVAGAILLALGWVLAIAALVLRRDIPLLPLEPGS
ncbi:MAG: phosphatase PAP2 family protein [Chloroflexota bacterium]|nr:phosphatase PAP2 family protein [Chloroflexota bacterium]